MTTKEVPMNASSELPYRGSNWAIIFDTIRHKKVATPSIKAPLRADTYLTERFFMKIFYDLMVTKYINMKVCFTIPDGSIQMTPCQM